MKLILFLGCLVIYIFHTLANNCQGLARKPGCNETMDVGHSKLPRCLWNVNKAMWYYNKSRRGCRRLKYLGCGGNSNRFCTLNDCVKKCVINTL
ncbi:hypothetical protein KR044_005928 [Drosophila immigrans]|nr:hypothetical protein KR044_005928 [Drosophila immigrans]